MEPGLEQGLRVPDRVRSFNPERPFFEVLENTWPQGVPVVIRETDRPPRENWGRLIFRPYLRPVKDGRRPRRSIALTLMAMLVAAIALGAALASLVHTFG